jgi:TIR domain
MKVMFSYRSTEVRFVTKLAAYLRKRGVIPWIDSEGIKPGSKWRDVLLEQLKTCDACIVVLSPEYLKSEHCRMEVMACSRRTQSCVVKSFPLHLSLQPSPQTITLMARLAGADELGQAAQTGLRHRHRTLPELRRQLEEHRRPFDMLRTDIEDPPVILRILTHLGLPTRAATLPCAAIRSIPDNLRSRKPVANASRRRRSL